MMNSSNKLPRPNTKIFTILKHFATGRTLHRFQAEKIGDHTLNSSISGITRAYGLIFKSEWIKVPTNYDKPARVKKYWLEDEHLAKAQLLIILS